ncbi:HNH endonuclease [Permianibacter aggregans]|uniref:HNH endonuclease n=1 Tax=Permianibacter aggregans TaxID=1510150 RepID=A0A4R6UTJ6_9GAMM|nr:HNH endonuclease signature motif containing protein [Permianibacter aggregans]TDQ49033.1 HNH endonuclease [Permianibacter aggregans]
MLWANAGSNCSLCRQRLAQITSNGRAAVIGEAAHIIAESLDGPRGQSILDISERNSYFNLILLCPTCHKLVDKDTASYPPEKLHMLKAQHEMRQSGQRLVESIEVAQAIDHGNDRDVINFANNWAGFVPFYAKLFSQIQLTQMKGDDIDDALIMQAQEWHDRRDRLKELLFIAGEENTHIHRIASWERHKRNHEYIELGQYLTPFSFILDFLNPFHMIANYSDELWGAFNISHEFMDYLRFKYPELKKPLRSD